MPPRAKRPCRQPMCPATTKDPKGYCDKHAHLASGWAKPDRGTAEQRGYGAAWKVIRAAVAKRDRFLCVPCLAAGKPAPMHSIDHKVPRFEGGSDDESNLWALCKACHTEKTQAEALRARKR